MYGDDEHNDTQIVDVSESLEADGSASLVGMTIGGRYRIERRIARGGMGVVYLAEHTTLGRTVVFKVLSYHLSSDLKARSRFEREARGLSVLDHPNIVTVHDFGHDKDLTYIVMEYVEGHTLSELIRAKVRFTYDEFLPVAAQIVDAICAAHAADIIHRDLKPSNVMITERAGRGDVVKVLDFGLARLQSSSVDITKGNLVGTVSYLSPEVIKGERATKAADVYALGILFYYMLAGRKPFNAADDMSVLYQHVNVVPDPLSDHVPPGEVPDGMIDFIHRCIAKDVADRPKNALEMKAMMSEMVSLPSISAFSIDAPAPTLRPSGTHNPMAAEPSFDRSRTSSLGIRPSPVNRVLVVAFVSFSVGLAGIAAWLAFGKPRNPRGSEIVSEHPTDAPPSSETEAPTPNANTGVVSISSKPEGLVAVDGKLHGRTPVRLELPAGSHVVAVSQPGFEVWSETIVVKGGAERQFDVFLRASGTPSMAMDPAAKTPKPKLERRPVKTDRPVKPTETSRPANKPDDGTLLPPDESEADSGPKGLLPVN